MHPISQKKTGKPAEACTTVQVCDAHAAGQYPEAGNKIIPSLRSRKALLFYDHVIAGELPH